MTCQAAQSVFVGLSGGVDSSVSAALLKKAGYDVTGVFIRVWNPRSNLASGERFDLGCAMSDDRLDAMRICATVGIPFVEQNLEKEYKREVVNYMIREYRAGRTPNPDVFCNRFIKFGAFYDWARKSGADFVATGHYARIVESSKLEVKSLKPGDLQLTTYNLQLLAGSDPQKDQSYFLWQLRREQLPHILFPVGGMKKPEVRLLAKKFGLATADKKDSQGLCFVGKVDMKEFLAQYIRPRKGSVLDEWGKVIGEHDGVFFYTIGERIRFAAQTRAELTRKHAESGPYFVIAKDTRRTTLTVSHKSPLGELPSGIREVTITNCNWLIEPEEGKAYQARVRYRQPLQNAKVKNQNAKWTILFEKPQTVAVGQSLVLYDDATLVGGGIIA